MRYRNEELMVKANVSLGYRKKRLGGTLQEQERQREAGSTGEQRPKIVCLLDLSIGLSESIDLN